MKNVLIAILVVGGFCGCLKGSSNSSFTCNYNECDKVAPATEIDSLKKYLAIKGISATQHCSGMFYTIDTLGTGVNPGGCSNVAFGYEGKLLNDTTFEKSNGPVVANMGNLIPGFRNGLQKIKVGGHMHMYIPPSLGYGNTSPSPKVPANSYLIYEVALAGAQ
jgi:FKBP-type peptidyl-prolyl cis-trans isomerase FkpA